MRDHRKLKAFDLADEMTQRVYGATCAFPEEQFSLGAELRRSAVETTSRIVAGCALGSQEAFLRSMEEALGSSKRVEYQLGLARRLGYIEGDGGRELDESCQGTCKVLAGLIRSMRDGGKRGEGERGGRPATDGGGQDGGRQERTRRSAPPVMPPR